MCLGRPRFVQHRFDLKFALQPIVFCIARRENDMRCEITIRLFYFCLAGVDPLTGKCRFYQIDNEADLVGVVDDHGQTDDIGNLRNRSLAGEIFDPFLGNLRGRFECCIS